MLARRHRLSLVLNNEHGVELFQQFIHMTASNILQHAIIRQNLHLVVRKNYRQKNRAVTSPFAALIDSRRRRAPMMPIRNVKLFEPLKRAFDKGDVAGMRQHP